MFHIPWINEMYLSYLYLAPEDDDEKEEALMGKPWRWEKNWSIGVSVCHFNSFLDKYENEKQNKCNFKVFYYRTPYYTGMLQYEILVHCQHC